MNTYAAQSYFNELCDANFVAYEELRRLKNDAKRNDERITDFDEVDFWSRRLNDVELLIETMIEIMAIYKIRIVISSRKAVLALICYYSYEGFIYDPDGIINMDESFKEVFPQDEISQRFLVAYLEKNDEEMKELYASTYAKDVIF